ncbi:MAG TPA: response regulator, partial [Bryobacteraceae bacterium]|nr:response regulator [Bryobacteraceae bacterium]
MTLEEFVRALDSAGLDLHVEGLLDTLWLAQVDRTLSARRSIARHAMRDTAPGGQPSFKPDGDVTPPVSDQQSVEPPTEPPAQPPVTDPPDSAPVYSAGPAGAADKTFRASPVVVPAGHALSKRLALGRALRPFRRRWASRTDREIDEDRTVDISADLGGMYPVFRPRAERWYDAVVVMEDDPAIEIWQDVLRDFCQMLRHTGAFRDVRRLRLRMDPKPFLESVPGGARSRASSLSGGGARRLVFFATHGSSSKWADGRYARLIEPWMGTCSVAILQMQPPRRWKWTVLGEPQGVCTALQPGVSSARLQLEPNWWSFLSADDERVIGLPVVPLESAAMSEFAYMQMARGRRCPLLLLDTSELDADEMQFLPVPSPDAERTLALLRESAPLSYQLAVYLAGGPFTLPVARIVQEAMFGDAADQSHLADVLLSGQVTSPQTTALAVDPNLVYYEFKPEARAILLRSLREADAERIAEGLETCVSQYIEKVYGRTITFQGLVPDENGEYELPAWAQSFARLSVALLGLPGRKVKAEASQAYTDLLIRIVASSDGNQIVEAIINSGAPSARAHLKLDMSLLERLKPEDATYGQELDRAILFGPVLSALDEAMKRPASSNGKGRIRLEIDQGLGLLHGIAWERMTLPDGMPSIMPFSRYIPTGASVPQPLTARRIRMSICIDRPTSTEVALELTSLMATLSAAAIAGNLDVTLLTGHTSLSDALRSDVERAGWRIVDGPTTLNAIIARLAVDDIVHIDAPGSGSGVQGLSLDLKTGSGAWSLDSEIVRTAGPRLPALVTVCLPWRTGEKRAFHELPAALVRAGASAVLALQDQIAPNSGRQIGQAFYRALFETGLVDYAVTTARQELREAGAADWWMPVLYSRVPDCRLLSVDRAASPQDSVKAFVSAYPKRDVGRVARLAASTGGEKFAANTIGTELSRSLERDGLVRQYGDGTFRFLPGIEPLLSEIVSKQPLLGVHILWVDDHPDRIASFANDLRGRGAEIDEVILEDVAMKFLEHAAYDVVISDMKRGNDRQAGISLLRAMQSRRIASPVVIFSGRFAANRVQEILGEGA